MRYDPQTVWSSTLAWCLDASGETAPKGSSGLMPGHLLRLYVYVRGRDGCYYLAGPKLNWMDTPPSGELSPVDQGDLKENAEELGHVIAVNPVSRDERFWPTWEAFAKDTGLADL
ncbi:MAG: hypothetical protein ACOC8D_02410 [bacterium]